MSRIGKRPVTIPADIKVLLDGDLLKFSKGKIVEEYLVDSCVNVKLENNCLSFAPKDGFKNSAAIWGTTQKNVSNIIHGMSKGFSTDLELIGVGYKAAVAGKQLVLELGYSHNIKYNIPEGITIVCSKPTLITVSGHSKKQVGDVVAIIKTYRKVEPYKGKGIVRSGDFVYRKEGKKK